MVDTKAKLHPLEDRSPLQSLRDEPSLSRNVALMPISPASHLMPSPTF